MDMSVAHVASPTDSDLTELNARFEHRSPESLLAWTAETYGSHAVLTCSFGGASGMVLLDMVAALNRPMAVVFLDTGLLFPETHALAEKVARRYGIAVEHRRPSTTLDEQDRHHGPQLYARDPDRCCGIRKVLPLADALQPYAAWVSGIRRDQSASRRATPLLQWNERHQLVKISPLARWTERDVWRYIHDHNVPYNALLDQGYVSLGCAPCTAPAGGEDLRAGRWVGFAKTECGIHA
jgi:phosphoadenosine phosphosulfate reductase